MLSSFEFLSIDIKLCELMWHNAFWENVFVDFYSVFSVGSSGESYMRGAGSTIPTDQKFGAPFGDTEMSSV